jgi:hypothetical protein
MAGTTSLNTSARVADRSPGPYSSGIVALTASATLDWTHNNKTVTTAAAAGLTITLPAASGSGWRCKIVNKTTVTSNSLVVQVANTTDAFNGFSMIVSDDAGGPVKGFIASAGSDDTITWNGTTTGGYVGDMIEIEDIASGLFQVKVLGKATGTEATPFSAAV